MGGDDDEDHDIKTVEYEMAPSQPEAVRMPNSLPVRVQRDHQTTDSRASLNKSYFERVQWPKLKLKYIEISDLINKDLWKRENCNSILKIFDI